MSITQCSVKNCINKAGARKGLCYGHYSRLKKYGSVNAAVPLQKRTDYKSRYPHEYKIYRNLKARIYNKNNPHYKNYGGRGVDIDPEWRYSFENFIDHVGGRPSKELTLDRIDNDKGYIKGNIRWTTRQVQAQNQRKRENKQTGHRGITLTPDGKFMVRIGVNYERVYIGRFDTLDEAKAKRVEAERKYFDSIC